MLAADYGHRVGKKKENRTSYLHNAGGGDERESSQALASSFDLFHMQGRGGRELVCLAPARRLERYGSIAVHAARFTQRTTGYLEVRLSPDTRPHVVRRVGHWETSARNMLRTESEKRDFAIKR